MSKTSLLVVGHARNLQDHQKLFVGNHLGIFECSNRVLYTHLEKGWWTPDMTKTIEDDSSLVNLQAIREYGFFDDCKFIDLSNRDVVAAEYKTLKIHPERSYWREPSFKMQVVHRYLALSQFISSSQLAEDDIIILTRPDVLIKPVHAVPIIQRAITEFSASKHDLLLFYWGGYPGDPLIVGRSSQVLRLVSPEIYNTYEYVGFENLDAVSKTHFDCMRVSVDDLYYFAHSPNMGQYGNGRN